MEVVQMKYHPKEVYYESRGNVHYIVLVYEDSKVEHVIAAQQSVQVDLPTVTACSCGARGYEPHKRWCHTNTASH